MMVCSVVVIVGIVVVIRVVIGVVGFIITVGIVAVKFGGERVSCSVREEKSQIGFGLTSKIADSIHDLVRHGEGRPAVAIDTLPSG